MHSSIIFTLLAATATLTAAAPSLGSKRDNTVCAPGTGFFQSCSNGFRGCCKVDACTIGYCPDVTGASDNKPAETAPVTTGHSAHWQPTDPTVCAPGAGFFQSCANGFRGCCKEDACSIGHCPSASEKRQDPTVCAPGTGFFQSCSNGFRGCCKSDACSLGYCSDVKIDNTKTVNTETVNTGAVKSQDPTVCAPGTGFFQSCSNGFRGCCKSDACSLGYCPPTSEKRQDPTVCVPGTGFFQSCSNGFRGCCKSDACSLGYCPDVKTAAAEKRAAAADPTVCAPGTGFFQSCSNGFRGCCKQDACTVGYCPDVKTFQTVAKTAPKTTPTPTPEAKCDDSNNNNNNGNGSGNGNADPTVCAPGTGFFQTCSNGFRGCCKQDACTLGHCPSN
ncbi:hypothetical protein CH63R_12310 [Colletotrichum higginsianum IMI 349063]|uniref:Uncharacterized protein n=3 Tax=Colletotrichum higginsianum TaxID=80884 RepID=A0A1B7XTV7_COLHI|nr:hypothetical protein CH63R_12310 [Colletotrichum higginsianum IMI 349063]OBR03183.1 hypothetical protein CH63R_12310 [Colletotrichum higginsianum IMI 349063]TIC89900.1 hypothetical protein CH35J_012291 [Colletotrichum higginsianum]